jgi:MOSC domain-containing protein YiiM
MVTVMSARMAALLGDTDDVRALAGDQLYVDLDISHGNLPAGSHLAIGDQAVLRVSAKPHTGCKKFLARYGADAVAFVNSEDGIAMRLRGLNARVLCGGVVRPGDVVRRVG